MIDDTARRSYWERAREIKELLEADVADRHREQLRSELEDIEAELKRTSGLGGRIRPFSSKQENARTLVNKNMTRALADIELELPPLHSHLRDSLELGHMCRYHPRVPIRWEIAS